MKAKHPTLLVVAETPADGKRICQILGQISGIEILGLWNGKEDPESFITSLRPDILLLGVNLPGSNGLDLLERMKGRPKPVLIIVSETVGHAVRAFHYHPLDFLITPIDEVRLRESIDRAKRLFLQEVEVSALDQLQPLPEAPIAERRVIRRIMVKSGGRIFFIRPEEIDWVAAERDYVCIHNSGKRHLIREKISEMERNLPNNRFLRIHRSTIVNIERISELHPMSYGEYAVVLNDGTQLVMSRSYRGRVFSRLTNAA